MELQIETLPQATNTALIVFLSLCAFELIVLTLVVYRKVKNGGAELLQITRPSLILQGVSIVLIVVVIILLTVVS